jgi:hypothetical protein
LEDEEKEGSDTDYNFAVEGSLLYMRYEAILLNGLRVVDFYRPVEVTLSNPNMFVDTVVDMVAALEDRPFVRAPVAAYSMVVSPPRGPWPPCLVE